MLGNFSNKEREKLRKRLKTLFPNLGEPCVFNNGKCNRNNLHLESKQEHQQVNGQIEPHNISFNSDQCKTDRYEFSKEKSTDLKRSKLGKRILNKNIKLKKMQNSKTVLKNQQCGKQLTFNKKNLQKSKINGPEKPQISMKEKGNQRKSQSTKINLQTKSEINKKQDKPKTNTVLTNGKKILSNQKENGKKRTAAAEVLNDQQTKSKKPKLNEKLGNKKLKCKKSHHDKCQDFSCFSTSSSQHQNEFDVSNMTGYVKGGDFDSDHEESDFDHDYWAQKENSSYDENDLELSEKSKNFVTLKYKEHLNGYVDQYELKSSDSEDDSDDDEYFDDSEEEEEENYSDFDENDYEEDEDSYSYSMESEDMSSNYEDYDDNILYDFIDDDNDVDYKLPEHVPEDLIIHSGTASVREIKPEDNVAFDSDNENAQIVELQEQETVKVIKQPKAYNKDELIKLKYKENSIKTVTFHKEEQITNNLDDCPKLVRIADKNVSQLCNSEEKNKEFHKERKLLEYDSVDDCEDKTMDELSLGSEYMEIDSNDADSFLSEDINEKYLNRGAGHDSLNKDVWLKKDKVDIIDATGCEMEGMENKGEYKSDLNLIDDICQIPLLKLYENVDLSTTSRILSTTIIDDKHFKSNNICVTSKRTPDTFIRKSKCSDNEIFLEECDEREQIRCPASASSFEYIKKRPTKDGNPTGEYNTVFINALDSNLVIVLLKDPFYIYGTVCLTLLVGTVEVYGHSLSQNIEVEIFSPRGCSVIEISSISQNENCSKDNLKEILLKYEQNFALADLKMISDKYDCRNDAVVLLKRNDSYKKVVQQFKKFMKESVFPNRNDISVDRPLYISEYLLQCMINTSAQEQICLQLPQQWRQFNLTLQSRVMVVGGKNVGKSTLVRYLINRYLPLPILLIDLDIGQPEVFVPQTVSCTVIKQPLLGPGFMLNLQPEMSYPVGHTNIALCAHKYIENVRNLISYCLAQEKYKELPWLINTMGYNKGFGLELISVIAKYLPLTDVIQLQSSKDIYNFDSILYPHVISNVPRSIFLEESCDNGNVENQNYRLHVWQSAVQQEFNFQKEWEMSAKDFRLAILLARLSEALKGHAEWLTDCKPLSTSLHKLKIINLMDNTLTLSSEEMAKSIEANLVYLCHYEDDNQPLICLGIGVVRAIDFHIQQLYLLPAVPHSYLKDVNCVAIGEMPLPTSVYTNQGPRVKNVAPFVYNTIAAKCSKAVRQIYHRPPEFLTGKHKSFD